MLSELDNWWRQNKGLRLTFVTRNESIYRLQHVNQDSDECRSHSLWSCETLSERRILFRIRFYIKHEELPVNSVHLLHMKFIMNLFLKVNPIQMTCTRLFFVLIVIVFVSKKKLQESEIQMDMQSN